MASRWQKVINILRALPFRRNVEEVTGSVARKNAKKVLERFLPFSEQRDFSSLINPVRRHWYQRWEEEGKFEKRRKCDAFTFPLHRQLWLSDLTALSASSNCCFNTCYICFLWLPIIWTDHTGWTKQRKETLGWHVLLFVVGDFTVTVREAHGVLYDCLLGYQLESH